MPFIAYRHILGIDCSVPEACVLAAASYGYVWGGPIPLSFTATIQPALTIGVTLSPTGTVDFKNGWATLTGTVTCNRPALVDVAGWTTQELDNGSVAYNDFDTGVNIRCMGSTTWTADVPSGDLFLVPPGVFRPGRASVTFGATGDVLGVSPTIGDVTPLFFDSVVLKPSKP